MLSCYTTLSQSGLGSNGNNGVLHIPQSSRITGTSPSDCLVSYPRHSLWKGGIISLCKDLVCVFYSPSQLGKNTLEPDFKYITYQFRAIINLVVT